MDGSRVGIGDLLWLGMEPWEQMVSMSLKDENAKLKESRFREMLLLLEDEDLDHGRHITYA